MKLCIISIQPQSAFGTPMMGDTIFGQFCWQAAENEMLTGGLDRWISCYKEQPFVVFSSAFPQISKDGAPYYAMPRPVMPRPNKINGGVKERFQRVTTRKKDKKKKYLLIGDDLSPTFLPENYYSEKELFELHLASLPQGVQKKLCLLNSKDKKFSGIYTQAHNTIDRLTGTTGTGEFAPFSSDNIHFLPDAKLAVLALFNEDAMDVTRLAETFGNIGTWGFGRDASAGLGRFQITDVCERELPTFNKGHNAYYTLAPCVPEKNAFSASFFTPFTRFGKHGAGLLHKNNPFKNPVVMAAEGAVFMPTQPPSRQYIGTAVGNLSKADARTVMQGYSISLPCALEVSA